MKEVYDVTMRSTDSNASMIEVTARMKGLTRAVAIEHAQILFPAYKVKYVIKMQSEE